MDLEKGHFYFLTPEFYLTFQDMGLMNDENRPAMMSFYDKGTGFYWLIPISSRVEKYERTYAQKMKKYGLCDTIVFGDVLGVRKAFLIQNMFPVTPEFILNEYLSNNESVRIATPVEEEIIIKAKKVLALSRYKKAGLLFTNISKMTEILNK